MSKRYPDNLLRDLRNNIPIDTVVIDMLRLDIQNINKDEFLRFRCPLYGKFHTVTNPKINLARCFDCEKNYNLSTS